MERDEGSGHVLLSAEKHLSYFRYGKFWKDFWMHSTYRLEEGHCVYFFL